MAEDTIVEASEPPSVADLSVSDAPKSTEQVIDPWSVKAGTDAQGNILGFNYEAISKTWNTSLIDDALLEKFERITGKKPHRWLRRGLFFSHRDFDNILNLYEKGEPFFLYTGRGPSSDSMHIGHTIPFEFTKWLQETFDVPLVIMLTDDEKFLFKEGLSLEEVERFAIDNAKDILSMGFDVKRTFIYSDLRHVYGSARHFNYNALEFSKLITFNQVRGAFGFDSSTNTGRIFYPNLQCVAAFATSYPELFGADPKAPRRKDIAQIPCLIPCAIDQDPYFRLLRENCPRMPHKIPKPALIHSKFLTALQGAGGKMSASDPNSAIFMSDTPNQIKKKINSHAFSGGRDTLELHRQLGGNPDVDVAYQYLTYFDDDDAKLKRLHDEYKKGELLTGDMKKECIRVMQEYVTGFQARRAQVTDEVLEEFMRPRALEYRGNPNQPDPREKLEKARQTAEMEAEEVKNKAQAKAAKAKEKRWEKQNPAKPAVPPPAPDTTEPPRRDEKAVV